MVKAKEFEKETDDEEDDDGQDVADSLARVNVAP